MKKLIIVCEEKLRQYGDFLSQLISLVDDKENDIVGVKDGSVVAQVWTEKEYVANAPQISSEQYILFIGNNKMIKDKSAHMIKKYDKYGMQYGWLGKQAVLFVEKIVDMLEYEDFIEYAKANQSDIRKLIELKSNVVLTQTEEDTKESKGMNKLLTTAKTLSTAITNVSIQGINVFNKIANNKKIENQEYTCLILEFYLNGLSDFLGLSEE